MQRTCRKSQSSHRSPKAKPKRPSREQLNASNARRYPAPRGGERLNVSAVCVDFGVNYWTFMQRQRRGWVSLGGDKLIPEKRTFGHEGENGNRFEDTFLRSEVAEALEVSATTNGRYELDDGTVRLNRNRVLRELGRGRAPMSRTTLRKLEAAGKIVFTDWNSPETGYWEGTADEEQVNRLKNELATASKDRKLIDGVWHIKTERTRRVLTVGKRRVSIFSLRRWEDRCPHTRSGKLHVQKKRGCPTWYNEEDILEIKGSLLLLSNGHYGRPEDPQLPMKAAMKHVGCDRKALLRLEGDGKLTSIFEPNKNGLPSRAPGRKKPVKRTYRLSELNGVKASGFARRSPFNGEYATPAGMRFNLTRAAKYTGYSRNFLKKCIKSTRYHPNGRLPAKLLPRLGPPAKGRTEHTILVTDLDLLGKGREEARGAVSIGFTADQLAAEHGASDLNARIQIGSLLRIWRERGELEADCLPRQRAFRYDRDQFKSLLAGRSVEQALWEEQWLKTSGKAVEQRPATEIEQQRENQPSRAHAEQHDATVAAMADRAAANVEGNDRPPATRQVRMQPKEWWLAAALKAVQEDPNLSDRKIAQRVGVSPSTLSRSNTYQKVADMARHPRDLPTGYKQGNTGDMDAWDTNER